MGEIRLGLVWLGKIARDQHLPAIAATPGIALAGIASRNAGLPDLPSFPTLEALLASGTPPNPVSLIPILLSTLVAALASVGYMFLTE